MRYENNKLNKWHLTESILFIVNGVVTALRIMKHAIGMKNINVQKDGNN